MTGLYIAGGAYLLGVVWAYIMQRRTPENVVVNGYLYRVFLIALTWFFCYMLFTQEIRFTVLRVILAAIGLLTLYGVFESFRFKLFFDEQGFRYRKGLSWKQHTYSDVIDVSYAKRDKSSKTLYYKTVDGTFSISDGMTNARAFYEQVRAYSDLTGLQRWDS